MSFGGYIRCPVEHQQHPPTAVPTLAPFTTAAPNQTQWLAVHSTVAPHTEHSSGGTGFFDEVKFPSTLAMYGLLALQALIFALVVLLKLRGVKVGRRKEIFAFFVQQREFDESTKNTFWFVFFVCHLLYSLFSCLLLQLHQLEETSEISRITLLCARFLIGTTCVALTIALNHQRLHRHREFEDFDGRIQNIEKQATRVNRFVAVFFLVFILADFGASHIKNPTHFVTGLFFWIFIVAFLLVNLPALFAGTWVCVNKGELRPTQGARIFLGLGIYLRVIGLLPAQFWNGHIWKDYSDDTPCPMSVLSLFDLILLLEIISLFFIMAFVWMEYTRNRARQYETITHRLSREYELTYDTNSEGTLDGRMYGVHSNSGLSDTIQ